MKVRGIVCIVLKRYAFLQNEKKDNLKKAKEIKQVGGEKKEKKKKSTSYPLESLAGR